MCLTRSAWYGILDLADLYGWNPLGTLLHGEWEDLPIPISGYDSGEWNGVLTQSGLSEEPVGGDGKSQLIILEDALNLADALEQAFCEYEAVQVPASYYLFEPQDEYLRQRPSIGALREVIELCHLGAFLVEVVRQA